MDGGGFRRVPRLFLNECLDFPGSYWINLDAKKARTLDVSWDSGPHWIFSDPALVELWGVELPLEGP